MSGFQKRHRLKRHRVGFTLVELLVVIAIIGLLVSLLLPAVQSARESGRQATCLSNIRQLGVAAISYENAKSEFPRANVPQPGHNWAPYLFAYLEEQNLQDIYDFQVAWNHRNNRDAIQVVVGVFNCASSPQTGDRFDTVNGVKAAIVDYGPPTSYSQQLVRNRYVDNVKDRWGIINPNGSSRAHVKDGLSHSLLFAEDAGRPYFYTSQGPGPQNNTPGGGNLPVQNGRVRGAGWADRSNSIPLHGFSPDGLKAPGPCPINCTNNNEAFSFHPGGVNVIFGDGHTKLLSEEISIRTYAALITRNGKEIIPAYD